MGNWESAIATETLKLEKSTQKWLGVDLEEGITQLWNLFEWGRVYIWVVIILQTTAGNHRDVMWSINYMLQPNRFDTLSEKLLLRSNFIFFFFFFSLFICVYLNTVLKTFEWNWASFGKQRTWKQYLKMNRQSLQIIHNTGIVFPSFFSKLWSTQFFHIVLKARRTRVHLWWNVLSLADN